MELLYTLGVNDSRLLISEADDRHELCQNEGYLLIASENDIIYQIQYNSSYDGVSRVASTEVVNWKENKSLQIKPADILATLKTVYISNILTCSDFELTKRICGWNKDYAGNRDGNMRYDNIYNCSMASWLQLYGRTENGQHLTVEEAIDNYFKYETYKQVKYVFDRRQNKLLEELKNEKYAIPYPVSLKIQFVENIFSFIDIDADKLLPELFPGTYQYLLIVREMYENGEIKFSEFKMAHHQLV